MKAICSILLCFFIVLSASGQESDSSVPKETIKNKALVIHQQSAPEPEPIKCPEKGFWEIENAWDLFIPCIVAVVTFFITKHFANASAKESNEAKITNDYEVALDAVANLDEEFSDARGIVEGAKKFENQTEDVKATLRNRVRNLVNRLNRIANMAHNDQDMFKLYCNRPDGLSDYLLVSYNIFQGAGKLLDMNDFDIRPLKNFKDKIDEQSG